LALCSMPHATTIAPPRAKRLAIARPIPVVPVTIATRPANSAILWCPFPCRNNAGPASKTKAVSHLR
jgi:hypothetical protein